MSLVDKRFHNDKFGAFIQINLDIIRKKRVRFLVIKKNACNYFFLRHIALFHQPNPLPVPEFIVWVG